MTIVKNTKRRFGASNKYVYARINGKDALLTPGQAVVAIDRAILQPEDVPTLQKRLLAWFGW